MMRLRDLMTTASKLRYLAWRVGLLGDEIEVRFAGGERLLLQKSMMLGLGTAYEIFVLDTYRCPRELPPESIRRIVDVGANVGYSAIYLAAKFPSARIDAFEPHPRHLEILRRSLRINRIEDRVRVCPVAVGIANGTCELIDAGAATGSAKNNAVLARSDFGRLVAEVVDFFEAVSSGPIDLLKLDCEGAEYEILMDSRFRDLPIRNLVMEWHATEEHPHAQRDLSERLRDLGWEIQPGTLENVEMVDGLGLLCGGVLWGFRR